MKYIITNTLPSGITLYFEGYVWSEDKGRVYPYATVSFAEAYLPRAKRMAKRFGHSDEKVEVLEISLVDLAK